MSSPLIYLILGASGSGRREVLVDLIDGGLREGDHDAVLLAETEAEDPADAKLAAATLAGSTRPTGASDAASLTRPAEAASSSAPLATVTRWRWTEDKIIEAPLPPEATHVFFVVDGRQGPMDQIEAFKVWLDAQGHELARILCVINCQLAEKNPPLLAWFEACVHFADIVLLNRREGVDNKWLTAFQAHFRDKFYPCLFELVKGSRVKNPLIILEPQARRMSHAFDEEQDWIFTDAEGEEIDEQEETDDEDGVEITQEEDPYLALDASGRRAKRIPDIAKFL
jgi:hypothetical protein